MRSDRQMWASIALFGALVLALCIFVVLVVG
jgi:hypothetical protein